MEQKKLELLIKKLLHEPRETEWLEFKVDNSAPDRMGIILSGLANAANLEGQPVGYLVYGITDSEHELVGTSLDPYKKIGAEELINWLQQRLSPKTDLKLYTCVLDGKKIVIFQISPAIDAPVRFGDTPYIRVGSITKKLQEYPDKQRKIWLNAEKKTFETGLAVSDISEDAVLSEIDYPGYFHLSERPLPVDKEKIIDILLSEKIIVSTQYGYGITNLGAILFAKNIEHFDSLKRKAIRLIIYRGNNKVETIKEVLGKKGYAVGFSGLFEYLVNLLPVNEALRNAIRVEEKMYPPEALRELIANALIHQDFSESGTGPMIEIYMDRIEISNPGKPLIAPALFMGRPPKSRNEKIAYVMRQMKLCEERGSGIVKVINGCEVYQLPAPKFEENENGFKVVLFSSKKLDGMDKQDKIRACYQHCCLKYVSGSYMTNESLRMRLGIKKENYTIASKIIDESIKRELIKPYNPDSKSKKHAKYVPIWA